MDLLGGYRALVCDLDGVVYRGLLAVPGAVESLRRVRLPVLYATNNASRAPETVARHLTDLGLPVSAGDVATSSQAGARHLAGALPAGSRVLAVGGPGVARALAAAGLAPVMPSDARREDCGAPAAGVLQGYGPEVTAADLAEASYAVASGAVWVATNTDATLPTERGTAPGNGTLVAAVASATGATPVVVGKPHPPLYLLCADRMGEAAGDVLAIGDRLDTDIEGAARAGMDSVLVLTGVDGADSLAVAPREMRPTYLLEDLRGLHVPYAVVSHDGDRWHCGGAAVRVDSGRWDVAGDGSRIEVLRAGIAALHEALDGGRLDPPDARHLAGTLAGSVATASR